MRRATLVIAAGIALCTGIAQAVDPSGNGKPLQVSIMQEAAEFEIPYYDAFITAGENKFTFVVPQGFRLKGDPMQGRIILGNRDGDCSLTFAILSSGSTDEGQLSVEACRAFLLKLHPDGKILLEFTARGAGQNGHGFDIQWQATEDLYQYERIALIPSAFGTLVFTATSGREHFKECQGDISLIMTTFRSSTDGKFKPIHIPDVN